MTEPVSKRARAVSPVRVVSLIGSRLEQGEEILISTTTSGSLNQQQQIVVYSEPEITASHLDNSQSGDGLSTAVTLYWIAT